MNQNDCLKYFRVICQYFKKKYKINQTELETLFFLRSEVYFRKTIFVEYSKLTSWYNRDFNTLIEKGFIQYFRNTGGPRNNIFQLSIKAKRMLTEFYSVIDGEELRVKGNNRYTKSKPLHRDKQYLAMIKRMNESIRQQQRQTLL